MGKCEPHGRFVQAVRTICASRTGDLLMGVCKTPVHNIIQKIIDNQSNHSTFLTDFNIISNGLFISIVF